MFRKLSVAALLVLASGAHAQKKVPSVPFCATPTLEAFGCRISDGTDVGFVLGDVICDGLNPAADSDVVIIRPASFDNPTLVGDHLSPLRAGACAAAGAGRIGVWEASCSRDIYEPIFVRLADDVVPAGGGSTPTQAQLVAACQAQVVTPAQALTADTLCNAQLSVTENTGAKAAMASKLGSSAWYNYLPVPAYTLIGGYINAAFDTPVAPGTRTQRYCVYWPQYNAVLGNTGGGTNKWAKPIINTVSTTSAFTNAPAGNAGFSPIPGNAAAANAINAALFNPRYQETITVNYVKNGPPAGSL